MQEAVYSATLDALMEGQREAAAILSEAHRRIERQRKVAGNAAAEEGGER